MQNIKILIKDNLTFFSFLINYLPKLLSFNNLRKTSSKKSFFNKTTKNNKTLISNFLIINKIINYHLKKHFSKFFPLKILKKNITKHY